MALYFGLADRHPQRALLLIRIAAIVFAALFLTTPMESAVNVEKIEYKGWPNCYRISNGEVELVVTGDVGPRIIHFGFTGGRNLFVEIPGDLGKTGGSEFRLYGGHRIWVAPEDPVRTYGVDNSPVEISVHDDGLRAVAPIEKETGIQKEIEVSLASSGTEVVVRHRITNRNVWPIELSPWALTMMAPGGTGVTTFPPRGTHPEVLAPTHPLVVWAFTNFSDPRWTLLEKYVVLRQDPANADPEKAGLFNPDTRGAYLLGSDLFIKKYTAQTGARYPDFHCSYETFTNSEFLELETLGPLQTLQPDQAAEHEETWSLHKNIEIQEWTDAELDRVLAPFLE